MALDPSPGILRGVGRHQHRFGGCSYPTGPLPGGPPGLWEPSLPIYEELGDQRSVAVVKGQLGTLALLQRDLPQAASRCQEAIALLQELQKPAMEAGAWHQLGMAHQAARHWDAAERAYRQAALLKEGLGPTLGSNGAAATWGQLALLCHARGKPREAEDWFRKAETAFSGTPGTA